MNDAADNTRDFLATDTIAVEQRAPTPCPHVSPPNDGVVEERHGHASARVTRTVLAILLFPFVELPLCFFARLRSLRGPSLLLQTERRLKDNLPAARGEPSICAKRTFVGNRMELSNHVLQMDGVRIGPCAPTREAGQ